MATLKSCMFLICLLIGLSSPCYALNNTMDAKTRIAIIKKVSPSVVKITVDKMIPPQPDLSDKPQKKKPERAVGVGSGVIINGPHGAIVTNAHVVSNQHAIIVTLKNGQRYRAQLIGEDKQHDLAILKIHASHLIAMPFGSSNKLQVGDSVMAIGTPYGLTQTVTAGVVSALHRPVNFTGYSNQLGGIQNYIQTDTPINPGNSGGALVNSQGQLVGINTAIIAPSDGANVGLGFAIPSEVVKNIAAQLIQYGQVKQGILGVIAQNMSPNLKEALKFKGNNGVLITQVIPHSPAQKAGLQSEDIITKINDDSINTSVALQNAVGLHPPGSTVTVTYLHHQRTQHKDVKLADTKTVMKKPLPTQRPFVAGMRLQTFSDLEPDGKIIKGVMILDLDETSDAALAGLIPGDVILTANHQPTPTVDSLLVITEKAPSLLLLKVHRAHTQVYTVLKKTTPEKNLKDTA